MQYISATQAKNSFGALVDQALSEPVVIQRGGRNTVVMMSYAEFAELKEIIERIYEEEV